MRKMAYAEMREMALAGGRKESYDSICTLPASIYQIKETIL